MAFALASRLGPSFGGPRPAVSFMGPEADLESSPDGLTLAGGQ